MTTIEFSIVILEFCFSNDKFVVVVAGGDIFMIMFNTWDTIFFSSNSLTLCIEKKFISYFIKKVDHNFEIFFFG
jgi:hypothetical protein